MDTSLPFRTASHSIDLNQWHYRHPSGASVIADVGIPGWDYLTKLVFERNVTINWPSVRTECGLPAQAPMNLSIVASCVDARFQECVWSKKASQTTERYIITFELTGEALARSIDLVTIVSLEEPSGCDDPFVASLPGSRLFEASTTILLEGNSSRFPIEVADFKEDLKLLESPDAMWYLSFDRTNLDSWAMADLQLVLNSRNRDFVQKAQDNDPNVVAVISSDIARQLISAALGDASFLENPDEYSEGTIGFAARKLMQTCFGASTVTEILSLRSMDPGQFDARIQSGAIPFDI